MLIAKQQSIHKGIQTWQDPGEDKLEISLYCHFKLVDKLLVFMEQNRSVT